MFEELHSTSEQLNIALERYLQVCCSIQGVCLQGLKSCNIPPEHSQQIDRELGLAESYYAKMEQAKRAIEITRNYAYSLSPINTLPPEILTHIFHMVCGDEPSCVDCLAIVCSRWRSLLLSTPSLWTDIDYCLNASDWDYQKRFARAQRHLSRSRQLPLYVRISAGWEWYAKCNYDGTLEELFRMVAPQIQCLELDLEDFYTKRLEDSVHLVFTALFGHCKPGMLTKLITMDPECFGFITVEGDETSLDVTLRVGLSDQELDKLFAPIKVLRLTGLFLPWSSLAYHDLVELCLYPTYTRAESGGNPGSIDESELVDILSASPCLRILRFGLSIIRQEEDDTPTSHRVRLPELGVLQVDPTWGYYMFDYIEDIFRLLEPGTKPLHLSIRNRAYWSGTEPYPTETGALFTRSNVRQLHLTEVPHLLELLPSLPYLEVLILSEQSSSLQLSPSTLPTQQCTNHEVIHPQLGICFILDCLLALSEVLLLVQACKPQTLILYGNRFYQDRFGEEVDTEEVGRELSAVCSDVRFTDTYPNLAEYQELVPDH